MSHTVQVKNIQCTNDVALENACGQLGLKLSGKGQHKLFDRQAEGRAVQLPGWRMPVVINTDSGMASYDNYGGSWGDQIELDKLMQRYATECARMEAIAHGLTPAGEETLDDGSIRLTLGDYASV